MSPRATPGIDRLLARVEEVDGCWIPQRAAGANGYVHVWDLGKNRLAHRLAYESLVGPIPEGWQLDHLCRNRACVNPDHLDRPGPRRRCRECGRIKFRAWAARKKGAAA